jgi:hypothetical protein
MREKIRLNSEYSEIIIYSYKLQFQKTLLTQVAFYLYDNINVLSGKLCA